MKKIYLLAFLAFASVLNCKAQICDTSGNVIIYSNYDGGILNINVDQNIPNLKIGIVTYEAVRVQISGQYSGNVTELRYAGYNGTNDNCNQGVNSVTLSGVPASICTTFIYPAVSYNNTNGNPNIVCNYSCSSTTNQGGCNTPDQIVYYFVNAFGGTFRYHDTQYSCWTNATGYNVSSGGNCCVVPTTLSTGNVSTKREKHFFPNPAKEELNIRFYNNQENQKVEIFNLLGEKVFEKRFEKSSEKEKIDVSQLPAGIYFVKMEGEGDEFIEKIVVE
jgi:hypothetical protein